MSEEREREEEKKGNEIARFSAAEKELSPRLGVSSDIAIHEVRIPHADTQTTIPTFSQLWG